MNVAALIEGPVSSRNPKRDGDGGQAPTTHGGASSAVACPSVAGSSGRAQQRPGELPAPRIVSVFAVDLEPGDVVVHGTRQVVVDAIARRVDGMIRVALADGTVCTAPADSPWEVCRG